MAKKPKIYSGRSGSVGRDGDNNYVWRPVGGLASGEKTTVRSGAKSSKTYLTGDRKTGAVTPGNKVKSPSGLANFLSNGKKRK